MTGQTRTATALAVWTMVQHVLAALAAGMVTFVVGIVTGIWSGVVGIMGFDPADHPFMDVWLTVVYMAAMLATGITWWLLHRSAASRTAS